MTAKDRREGRTAGRQLKELLARYWMWVITLVLVVVIAWIILG